MASLRWSDSNWYAYRHIDGGDGPQAIFMAKYGPEPALSVCLSAGEMQQAEEKYPGDWLPVMISSLPGGDGVPRGDVAELQTVAEQFLYGVFMAVLIPMPPELARRHHVLRRLVRRRVNRRLPPPEAASDTECPPTRSLVCADGIRSGRGSRSCKNSTASTPRHRFRTRSDS